MLARPACFNLNLIYHFQPGPSIDQGISEPPEMLIFGASCKIPLKLQNVAGHGFSRAERATKSRWTLAPAGFVFSYLQFRGG
jgi:hypothetical protein